MSLGFARDSILDLASMSKESGDSNITSSSGDNSGEAVDDSSDQQHDPIIPPSRTKNLYFAHNQQPAAQNASEVGLVLGGPPSSTGSGRRSYRSGSIGSATGSDAGSSAGQSTSSSVGSGRQSATTSKGAYSAFAYDYSAYEDYYNESDTWMNSYAAEGGGGGTKKKKSVFACLFAPWASPADKESDGESDDSSSHTKDRAEDDVNKAETGPEQSSSQLNDHGVDDYAEYRGALEVNDSVSLTKAKQLRQQGEAQSSASSALADLPSHAEEKKGDENDDNPESATGSTASTGFGSDVKVASTVALDEDDVTSHASCGSGDTDVYGEKLTEKDRQAVMARLRLSTGEPPAPAPPPEVSTSGSESGSGHGASSAFATPATATTATNKSKVKGILKHTSTMASCESLGSATSDNKKDQRDGPPDRRSLFPSYSTRKVHPSPDGNDGLLLSPSSKAVEFSPMARVVSVPSRREMSFVDKAGVWWQRSDYDDFKKTGRIIAKAMLQGGSEIWLSSNNAWERRAQQKKDATKSKSAEYDQALRVYVGEQDAGLDPAEDFDDYGSKWWCKFGHSRRGLEHIASMDEGRQRQRNVSSATRHILDEQRSQRLTRKRDSEKLAKVALQYTSWARDLALAAGASDAEAVRTNFARNAKDRGHYLRNGVGTAGSSNTGESTVALGHARAASDVHRIAPEILDANTSTHIYLQKKDAKEAAAAAAAAAAVTADSSRVAEPLTEPPAPSKDPAMNTSTSGSPDAEEGYITPDDGFSDMEVIDDPDPSHEEIAKQAAGFNQHSDEDGIDIGFIHKKQEAVGAH